jgi:type IV pilus assembly protein PilC
VPEFACRIGTTTGEIVERTYTAENEGTLRRELERKELLVISLKKKGDSASGLRALIPLKPRVGVKEFLLFNQELMALIRAGLPILGSLDILIERRKNQTFKRALIDIRERIKSGESLSTAFEAQGLFPKIFSSSLASGERSGEIATMLKRYIVYSRTVLAIRKKVVGAMIYPSILLTLSFVLIGILVYYVVPTFSDFFIGLSGGKVDLPLITQALVWFSNFVQRYILLMIGGAIALGIAYRLWHRTDAGRMTVDKVKLKIPLVGKILTSYAVSRFTRTMSTLVAGGIPLVSSLEITSQAVGNAVFERSIDNVARRVKEGEPMWESMEKTGLFSDMTVEMIKVGESTGSLEEMLTNVSDFLDEEIEQRISTLVALVEPLMLVFMAIVVGTILLAIYYPLLKLYSGSQMGAV